MDRNDEMFFHSSEFLDVAKNLSVGYEMELTVCPDPAQHPSLLATRIKPLPVGVVMFDIVIGQVSEVNQQNFCETIYAFIWLDEGTHLENNELQVILAGADILSKGTFCIIPLLLGLDRFYWAEVMKCKSQEEWIIGNY